MNHNEDENLDRLFAAARPFSPDTSEQENHFETRVMARILEQRSPRTMWLSWVWRFIPAFAVVVVILGAATLITETNRSPDILAAIVNGHEHQLITSYLTGG